MSNTGFENIKLHFMSISGDYDDFNNKYRAPIISLLDTYYKKIDSIGLNKSLFSAFVDYNASSDFTNVEEELVENLNYQITQDIFDKIFGGEW